MPSIDELGFTQNRRELAPLNRVDQPDTTAVIGLGEINQEIPDDSIEMEKMVIRSGQLTFNEGIGYWLGIDDGTPKFSIGDSSTAGNNMYWDGTNLFINGSTLSLEDTYGDGSDGDVSLSGTTTLTSDGFYNDLDLNGNILNTDGYRIFVKGSLSGSGTIRNNGNTNGGGGNGGNGSSGTGGTGGTGGSAPSAAAGNSVPAGETGVAGGAGGVGRGGDGAGIDSAAGTDPGAIDRVIITTTASIGAVGGTSGVASGRAAGNGGAAGDGGISGLAILNKVKNFPAAYFLSDSIGGWTNFRVCPKTGGSSGGGGGSGRDSTGGGGGGGGAGGSSSSGGIVWISAKSITATATIESKGGVGGNGGDGGDGHGGAIQYGSGGGGGGAGGSGGSGGSIIIITSSTDITYTTDISGGVGGTGGAGGAGGAGITNNGTAGSTGSTGEIGVDGEVITITI
jgi:hypothetical protein